MATPPPGQPIDALGTVRYALDHAPAILAQRATVAGAVATFDQRRQGEYPSVNGQLQNQIARSSNQAGAFAQYGVQPVNNFSQNTAQVYSQYNLYNGSVQINAQQAKRGVDGAAADLRRQAEQTTLDATSGFYDLAARRQVVVLDENDLRYQQQLLDAAVASERVGRVAGVDVLRAQVAVARSQATLVQARADEANAREALAVSIGASPDEAFAIPAQIPEPALPATPVERLAALAKASRPEVASAKAVFESALLGDAAVDSDLRPTVQLTGSFGSQVTPTSFVQQQASIDAANLAAVANYNEERALFPGVNFPPPVLIGPVTRRVPGFWQFGILSTLTLPAVDYGTRAANHRAARAKIVSAQGAYENAVDSVEADVRAALRNAQAAAEKLVLAKQSADLATESARIAQLQYKNGIISFTDATQTSQTALSAQNDLIAARVAYLVAFVKLRLSLGPPDPLAAADLRGV